MDTPVTPELLQKYDRPGPRYTSYPTVPEWKTDFAAPMYEKALQEAAQHPNRPLSLYIHIPFCPQRCAYCGCNTLSGVSADVCEHYIDLIIREMGLTQQHLGLRRHVAQCHWGGGTPTYLSIPQIIRLFGALKDAFLFSDSAEIAIETNPVSVTEEQLTCLRSLGFNRISLGVQDLNPAVQQAMGRHQTLQQTKQTVELCRHLGFSGINIDLIYGLPLQNENGWARTIEQLVAIHPDRFAIYSYAHLPQRFPHQEKLNTLPRPGAAAKYALFAAARKALLDAGYRAIGMDHFALPEDELSKALVQGTLNRNFMGYTVCQTPDQIGFGISAISEAANRYAQNTKEFQNYKNLISSGVLPTEKGLHLSVDDCLRRQVIRNLMCTFELDIPTIEKEFNIQFYDYFANIYDYLLLYQEENMLTLHPEKIVIGRLGAVFIRNICMLFDAYLPQSKTLLFSQTI